MNTKAMTIDRRRLFGAAGATALALGVATKVREEGGSQIMALFREWEARYHEWGVVAEKADTCVHSNWRANWCMNYCADLEHDIMALPAANAADFAAKIIVFTAYGDFTIGRGDPLLSEALALTGSKAVLS